MTPTLAEILRGNFMALAVPATAETAGDYLASRVAVIALLNLLAAQEAERGEAAAHAENDAIAVLLGDAAAAGYRVDAVVETAAPGPDPRDRRNAALRRALIGLHEAVERQRDRAFDTRILALYRQMAAWRRLELPPLPAAG